MIRRNFTLMQGKDSMNYVRTLVFPLEKAGNFNSKVQNLKVYNYCVSKP